MKKTLMIPIVIVLVLALAAGAILAYDAWSGKADVTVDEALVVTLGGGYGVPSASPTMLTLENKDAAWAIIDDDRLGVLTYNRVGETFDYSFDAMGLEPSSAYTSIEYSLIYYADYVDRMNEWGGDNPGYWFASGMTDYGGNLILEGSAPLNMNLPSPSDANIDVHDYSGPPDNYNRATNGAKIWLVPSDCYDAENSKVTTWAPARFLFETDLITYRYRAGTIDGDNITVIGLMPGETWVFEITVENLSTADIDVTLTAIAIGATGGVTMGFGDPPPETPHTVTVPGLGSVGLYGSIIAPQGVIPGGPYSFTVVVSR